MYINTYIYILNKLSHFGVYLKLIHFKSTALQFKYLQKKINETESIKRKKIRRKYVLVIHKTVWKQV